MGKTVRPSKLGICARRNLLGNSSIPKGVCKRPGCSCSCFLCSLGRKSWCLKPAFSAEILMACPHSGCRLQQQPGQMVSPRAPPPPPTCLSGRLLWLGCTRASSWRKLKARAGIGSPEHGAKLLQRCGRRVGNCQAGCRVHRGAILAVSDPYPTALPSPSSEHLWGLCPGAEAPSSRLPAERREGGPRRPWRARP